MNVKKMCSSLLKGFDFGFVKVALPVRKCNFGSNQNQVVEMLFLLCAH
jgi:hypothetical protein